MADDRFVKTAMVEWALMRDDYFEALRRVALPFLQSSGRPAGSIRISGSAPRDQWSEAFPRFRAVRDGIQPKG